MESSSSCPHSDSLIVSIDDSFADAKVNNLYFLFFFVIENIVQFYVPVTNSFSVQVN